MADYRAEAKVIPVDVKLHELLTKIIKNKYHNCHRCKNFLKIIMHGITIPSSRQILTGILF